MYASISVHMSAESLGPEEGAKFLGAKVTGGCELPDGGVGR